MKRSFDLFASLAGVVLVGPIIAVFAFLVWLQDRHNPFYIVERTGLNEEPFKMVKLRSMIKGADKSGVDSTAGDDDRITGIGKTIRKLKLDELPQLINVLLGKMSLVGPRPNVKRETKLYTVEEKRLLTVRPGITDFASIVFADEGEILSGLPDPDLSYNQLIRPGKSRLGLFYVENHSLNIDIQLILLTIIASFSRAKALNLTALLLEKNNAPADIVEIAKRNSALKPSPPPGADEIVQTRD